MASQFNPFFEWLGFEKRVTKPSHFELFGVKPHSGDPIGFKKQVHNSAKSLLAKLDSLSDEQIVERQSLYNRLRRHIVKAHEILMDDGLRTAYLKELRKKARDERGSAKPLAAPPPQRSNPDRAKKEAKSTKDRPATTGNSANRQLNAAEAMDKPEPDRE